MLTAACSHARRLRAPQYAGKAMRLDFFVVSAALLPRVLACEAEEPAAGVDPDALPTRGARGKAPAHYFGSDHWPLWMRLRPADAPQAVAGGAAGTT